MKVGKHFSSLLWFCLLSGFCGISLAAQTQPAATKPAQATKGATNPRTTKMTTDPALLSPATLHAMAPDVYEVKFITTKGDFVTRVTRAPRAAAASARAAPILPLE